MLYTIKTFSDLGYNVIVDHAFTDMDRDATLEKCIEILDGYDPYFIRVNCELLELARRERERGDRNIGQTKFQLDHVHGQKLYDYEVDTTKGNTAELADSIKRYVEMENPMVFKILLNSLKGTGTIY